MRLLIDFKQDSYSKLVEFLLPEDNCLIKSKLTILFNGKICHLSLQFTKKHAQMGSQLIEPTWIMIFLFVVLLYYILYSFRNECDNTNTITALRRLRQEITSSRSAWLHKKPLSKENKTKRTSMHQKHTGSREELHTRLKMRISTLSGFLM